MKNQMSKRDSALLERCVRVLEHDAYVLRLIDFFGTPLDAPLKLSTAEQQRKLDNFLRKMMLVCMRLMKGTLALHSPPGARGWLTQVAATTTGFTAGMFGAISIPAEVPITTALVLRAIAEIARDFPVPESMDDRQLECLFVMALAGRVRSPEPKTLYWSVRDTHRPAIIEAGRSIVISSATSTSSRAMTLVANECLSGLGLTLLEGGIGRMIPVVGAFSGAAMSFVIVSHYRRSAAAHFTLLALEKHYGHEHIRTRYLHAFEKQIAPKIRRKIKREQKRRKGGSRA